MTDAEYRKLMTEVEEAAEVATSMCATMVTHLKHNGWGWELDALLKDLNKRVDHVYAEIATTNADRQRAIEAEQQPAKAEEQAA